MNCQYCGEKTIPYRQYAYAVLANLPLELGLKLAVIVDAEVSRDQRKCFCAAPERGKESK